MSSSQHLETFIKEAECVVKVLQAQKKSIFVKLKTFAFAGTQDVLQFWLNRLDRIDQQPN